VGAMGGSESVVAQASSLANWQRVRVRVREVWVSARRET
jgi:hypothetical protein